MEPQHKKYLEELLVSYRQGRITKVEVKSGGSNLGYTVDVDKAIVWKDGIPYKLL
jgi:hypothetical protein